MSDRIEEEDLDEEHFQWAIASEPGETRHIIVWRNLNGKVIKREKFTGTKDEAEDKLLFETTDSFGIYEVSLTSVGHEQSS